MKTRDDDDFGAMVLCWCYARKQPDDEMARYGDQPTAGYLFVRFDGCERAHPHQ